MALERCGFLDLPDALFLVTLARLVRGASTMLISRQHKIAGSFTGCPGCGKQPKHFETLGRNLHHLECSPCNLRTLKMPTLQQAVELWEAQDVNNTRQ